MGFVVLFYSLRHSESLGLTLGSLSSNVFERRTSTGSGFFSFFDGGFAQIFSQIASITVKKLRNTNFISSRHVKRENTSLPVDVRRSKASLLKLPNIQNSLTAIVIFLRFAFLFFIASFQLLHITSEKKYKMDHITKL